jgi:hypothetical protein
MHHKYAGLQTVQKKSKRINLFLYMIDQNDLDKRLEYPVEQMLISSLSCLYKLTLLTKNYHLNA